MNQKNPDIYQPLLKDIPKNILLTSSDFTDGEMFDIQFTRYGANKMPSFHWNHIDGASYYALICVDLHKVAHEWVHLYIPYISIKKDRYGAENLDSKNSVVGKNSFGNYGYDGPQPPPGSGIHTYLFYLFAIQSNGNNKESEREKCRNPREFIEMIQLDWDSSSPSSSSASRHQKKNQKIIAYGTICAKYEK